MKCFQWIFFSEKSKIIKDDGLRNDHYYRKELSMPNTVGVYICEKYLWHKSDFPFSAFHHHQDLYQRSFEVFCHFTKSTAGRSLVTLRPNRVGILWSPWRKNLLKNIKLFSLCPGFLCFSTTSIIDRSDTGSSVSDIWEELAWKD